LALIQSKCIIDVAIGTKNIAYCIELSKKFHFRKLSDFIAQKGRIFEDDNIFNTPNEKAQNNPRIEGSLNYKY